MARFVVALAQGSFQLAFAQVVVLRHVHHHKPVFAAHRNGGFGLFCQCRFNCSDATYFEVIGGQLGHGGLGDKSLGFKCCRSHCKSCFKRCCQMIQPATSTPVVGCFGIL